MSNGNAVKHVARLCHIIKWPDFDGYGFNLHAEKGVPGQYIGKVDDNSPAVAAGLREFDRIIEVNGVNISNENHKQVVQRIMNVPNETKLLVVDKESDEYFNSKNIVVKSTSEGVVHLQTPPRKAENGITNGTESEKLSTNLTNGDKEPVSQPTEINEKGENEKNPLNLNMSVAEMRAQLRSKKSKKLEVKDRQMNVRAKYEIIQKM